MKLLKENSIYIVIYLILSSIIAPVFFYGDTQKEQFAWSNSSFEACNEIPTQYIRKRCYELVYKKRGQVCSHHLNKKECFDLINNDRQKVVLPDSFPIKLSLFIAIQVLLSFVIFIYFRKKRLS